MMREIFANILCPFVGTIAFSALYNVPNQYYFCCGITGAAGWIMYQCALEYSSAAIASFFGTLLVVLVSRMLTVRMKCPITIFLVSGILPLVPGAGIYYTVYYLVTNQLGLAAQKGLESVKIAFAIVLGIVCIVSIPREVFQYTYWKERRKRKG
ncbi:MAG: threonine/serine exporter family protein [Dorea sp.]